MPEKETRAKPRFNVIDAIILLAVIILVAGVGYKALYKPISNAVSQDLNVKFTVLLRSVLPDVAQSFVEELPSACVSNGLVVPRSTVKSAEIVPSFSVYPNSEGVLVEGVDPTRVDLRVTVEGIAPDDSGIYSIGGQEVRIGRTFNVKTLSVEISGIVTEITVTPAKG